jgi:peptidoglycan/LPS O-acetylase OafA/YrhL
MIYHYSVWSTGTAYGADSLLGRIGIYGVSVFYVLSGLTLFHVYHTMQPTGEELKKFFLKRIFRIFPLLWIATIGAMIVTENYHTWQKIALNLTGIFGFIKWEAYIATGAWSIGNELVFYVFFPIFIWLSRKSKIGFYALSLLIAVIAAYFTFMLLTPAQTLGEQWKNYIHPLNQLYLFLSGFWIGWLFYNLTPKPILMRAVLVIALLAFVFVPAEGSQVSLVTGWERVGFSVLCLIICIAFYKGKLALPGVANKVMSLLGEVSYSIYLLHPILYWALAGYFQLQGNDRFWAVPVTLIVSIITYYAIERPLMNIGGYVVKNKSSIVSSEAAKV